MLRHLATALVMALGLLAAPPAGAATKLSRDAQRVYDDYRSDAEIQPCDHAVAAYRRTLREITPDIEEETPAFRPAVEAALRERERGGEDCASEEDTGSGADKPAAPATGAGGTAAPPSAARPAPAAPPARPPAPAASPRPEPTVSATPAPTVAPPPPVTSSAPAAPSAPVLLDRSHEGTPLGLLIALGLLALGALAALAALLAPRLGWGDERLAGARHAWGEAAYRAGGTWADFVDWLRLGRGPHRL